MMIYNRLTAILACLAVFALFSGSTSANGSQGGNFFDIMLSLSKFTLNKAENVLNSLSSFKSDGTKERLELFYNYQDSDPDRNRNVSEVIRSRGYRCEEYDVVTQDGYILTIQRIVNPLVSPEYKPKMKPVILQHGLMSSSIDWVINSVNVQPAPYPVNSSSEADLPLRHERQAESSSEDEFDLSDDPRPFDNQEHPNALGFYLANRGYDVFLANSRGNLYGQRHVKMSKFDPRFWAFTYDEQIKYDLPDIISFIQELTKHQKVGYVGHSQGTVMGFGLLADRPEYADIIEPFVALAPVAFVSNTISPVKYFAVYTPVFQHVNMVFAPPNAVIKYLGPIVCGNDWVKKEVCENIVFLSCGFDWDEFDDSRSDVFIAHMPSGTSVKNIAHYGQGVLTGRFAHFNHGILGNQMKYKTSRAPDYKLGNIRSKSIALFTAENDWLASPKDVAKLRRSLKVKPFAVFNMTEDIPKFNHIDFVYAKDAGKFVNTKIEQVMDHFRDT